MLILAGVAIAAVVDGDGLFSKTRQAAETYENAIQDEGQDIDSLIDIIDEYMLNKYVDWSISNDGLIKAIDENGNLYIPEKKIDWSLNGEYINSGIKLVKVNDNIKASKFIPRNSEELEYIIDNTGKIYYFNEESQKCELLANGKEFYSESCGVISVR